MIQERERLGSRLGFIFLSAGCAIGLGNVWRFPFITGQYGGAAFVLLYILFLLIFGLPIMVMEFSIGRASQQNIGMAMKTLEPKGSKWHIYGPIAIGGNYVLMMFYTTVSGWLFAYFAAMAKGDLVGLDPAGVGAYFGGMLGNPMTMTFWMVLATLLGLGIVAIGLQKGVEKITKYMMGSLLAVMLVLVAKSVSLPGAGEGLKFYLLPDFGRLHDAGLWNAIYAAMGQAFFTLSIGIGSMAIFGSYIGKEHCCTGHVCRIDERSDHLPRLVCIQCLSRCGPVAHLHHPSEYLQCHARRTFVGDLVLRVHEFRGPFDPGRGLREYRELLDRPGMAEEKGCGRQYRGDNPVVPSVRPGLQCALGLPAARTRIGSIGFGGLYCQLDPFTSRLVGIPTLLLFEAWMGMEEFHRRSRCRQGHEVPHMGKIVCDLHSSGTGDIRIHHGVLEYILTVVLEIAAFLCVHDIGCLSAADSFVRKHYLQEDFQDHLPTGTRHPVICHARPMRILGKEDQRTTWFQDTDV